MRGQCKDWRCQFRVKRMLNKHLCKNFFEENGMPVSLGDSNIGEGDE